MKNFISTKQLMYSVALFIIASNLLTKSLYVYTKNETWIPVLIATVFFYILVSFYGKLAKNHPRCNLFGINEAVFGVTGGKIISVLYVFFFYTLTVLNTRDLGSFVNSIVLPSTPMNMIYIGFTIICAYAVKKGADKMTRYGAFIIFLYIAALIFISLLLLNKSNPDNFLPVFMVSPKNYLLSAHIVTMLPFGEIVVFMTMAHLISGQAEIGKAMKRGLILGAAVTLLIVVRDIAVMGNYLLLTSSPTFNTIRLIDIGDILTRLEIINAVFLIILLFFKTSILMYATVKGIGKLFGIEQYTIFTFVIGVLIIISANSFFQSSIEQTDWFKAAATYSTFFIFVLPIVTLIVSVIKKRAQKEEPTATPAEPQSM